MDRLVITTAAPNPGRSFQHYQSLGFNKRAENEHFSIYSDAQFDILVSPGHDARPGFTLFSTNPEEFIKAFPSSQCHNLGHCLLTADPNGVRTFIYPNYKLPVISGDRPSENNLCGNYYGAGIETTCFGETLAFWKLFGYKAGNEITEKTTYATLSRENGPDLTLFKPGTCPHAFYNPSLTYFNGKSGNPIAIKNLREADVEIVEEISIFNPEGIVDNIIISDPGGLHSFIFNDG